MLDRAGPGPQGLATACQTVGQDHQGGAGRRRPLRQTSRDLQESRHHLQITGGDTCGSNQLPRRREQLGPTAAVEPPADRPSWSLPHGCVVPLRAALSLQCLLVASARATKRRRQLRRLRRDRRQHPAEPEGKYTSVLDQWSAAMTVAPDLTMGVLDLATHPRHERGTLRGESEGELAHRRLTARALWQDLTSNGHVPEGSRDATAGTDLGRLCDDGAGGLCGAGHAGVSAPTPLSLAGTAESYPDPRVAQKPTGPRPTGYISIAAAWRRRRSSNR
jgi:hypothetical protein